MTAMEFLLYALVLIIAAGIVIWAFDAWCRHHDPDERRDRNWWG